MHERARRRSAVVLAVVLGALAVGASERAQTLIPIPGPDEGRTDPPARSGPTPEPEAEGAPAWERVFTDGFDGPAGTAPEQWHAMPGTNGALHDGQGRLEVGHLSQLRTLQGWTFPAGTQVRTTASLVMPDTGSNYAAFWVQHPDGNDPRELDVIESYGPLKTAGAQVGSHICYDDTPETAANACAATGRGPELWPVTHAFPAGVEPWNASWQYAADFTIGGDTVRFSATDGAGNKLYDVPSLSDARRVPSAAVPLHLRLSNKDVLPEHAVPGGLRHSMFVDWVTIDVKYPDAPDAGAGETVPPPADPAP